MHVKKRIIEVKIIQFPPFMDADLTHHQFVT